MDAASLIQKRGRILCCLTKASTFIESIDEETCIEDIEARLSKLESWWEIFYNIEDVLLLLPQQTSKSDEFEDKFFKTQGAMTREIRKRRSAAPTLPNDDLNATISNIYGQQKAYFDSFLEQTTMQNSEIKLPRINIPQFDGSYTQWPSFKDLFEATVHNKETMSRVHKFQLLKGLLRGDAARMINHFMITDANYSEAWTKLKKRYDKKRAIVNNTIKQFMDQPSIHNASSKSLRTLTETSDELLRGLKALGPECESRDPWIIYIMLNKMDDETREQWALQSVDIDMPTLENFSDFLQRRCDAIESCQVYNKPTRTTPKQTHVAIKRIECLYCNKTHPLHRCFKFQRCSVQDRKSFVDKNKLCTNCLKDGHSVAKCSSTNACYECQSKHHTILHELNENAYTREINSNLANSGAPKTEEPQQISSTSNAFTTEKMSNKTKQAILPTVIITTLDSHGRTHYIRALLDSGSESTFITENLTKQLGLKRKHSCVTVKGLSAISAGQTRGLVSVKLSSRFDSNELLIVEALILNKLTTCLPSQSVDLNDNFSSKIIGYQLADPKFNETKSIEMILGFSKIRRKYKIHK